MTKYLFLLLLTGCGQAPNNIDPTFQPLYNQFVADAGAAGIDLTGNQGVTIQFASLEQTSSLGEVIGECSNVGYGNDTIQIDSGFWSTATPVMQMLVFYHESGHCLLNEGHVSNPDSIMYPVINNPESYYTSTDWGGMISMLFIEEGDYPTNVP